MGKSYPQYRFEHAPCQSDPDGIQCVACDRPATRTVRIAYSYMRGEDEWEPVCNRHFKIIEDEASRFFAHRATKERFLKAKAGDA